MPAKFIFVKYTGKDSDFGTEVSSIGLKRVDAAVPAVYGDPVMPGDDTSDAMMYSVYTPSDPNESAYSFESVIKLKLVNPPDNQLSNVRIYPVGESPNDPSAPKLFIGCNYGGYTRPTNNKSNIAVNDIWSYSQAHPFKVSVGGVSGTVLDTQVSYGVFNITLGDIGAGNVIYLNNERQDTIQIVMPRQSVDDREYIFLDRTGGEVIFAVYDPTTSDQITNHPSITQGVDGSGRSFTRIIADAALINSYPNGLIYGSVFTSDVGGIIEWLDLDGEIITTEVHDVEVRLDAYGNSFYYIDGIDRFRVNFDLNRKYVFNNKSGSTDPMRFMYINSSKATESNIIVCAGITVQNGGTDNEIITVDPRKVFDDGFTVVAYQSTRNVNVGSRVTNTQTRYIGAYNINTVGGGVNPAAAGETDYIYLQLMVNGGSTVGNVVPQLAIEYDEN